jgi:hypothetical protein
MDDINIMLHREIKPLFFDPSQYFLYDMRGMNFCLYVYGPVH